MYKVRDLRRERFVIVVSCAEESKVHAQQLSVSVTAKKKKKWVDEGNHRQVIATCWLISRNLIVRTLLVGVRFCPLASVIGTRCKPIVCVAPTPSV